MKKAINVLNALRCYLPLAAFALFADSAVSLMMKNNISEASMLRQLPAGELAGIILLFAAALAMLGLMVFNLITKKKYPWHTVNSYALGAIAAFEAYCFTELCSGAFFLKDSVMFSFAAPLFVYALFLIGSIAFKKPKVYYMAVSAVLHLYGILQFFVYSFRGAPIRASDLNNLASAMEISGDYSLVSNGGLAMLVMTGFSLAACVMTVVFADIPPIRLKTRLFTLPALAAAIIVYGFFGIRLYDFGVENRIIKLNFSGGEDLISYKNSGNVLLFYLDVLNSGSNKPDGYSERKAVGILSEYAADDSRPERTPTVIAVMDESLADFAQLGDFETNKDYMPFYHSLTENTVKGFVTVSAYGGYSCNSEFEFLTGNSMGFFPMGSAAYTQYVKTPQDSLVSYFKDYGYYTLSMAGCSRTLWKLGEAYEKFGFEEQLYQNDLNSLDNEYVNGRVSDASLFRQLIKRYENKPEGRPMFAFMTTMQNHASYKIPSEPEITLSEIDDPTASAYLSYVYETDRALEMLINYFEDVDEEVVIVLFGDHYPHIPQFSEELLGSSLGTLSPEQNAKIHSTPFLIWANFDIEEKQDVRISLNYLSNLLVEAAGMPKTDFQMYLDDVMAEVPSISSFGYLGENGRWYRITDKSEYSELLNEYNIVQYYRMFEKNKE